MLRPIFCFLLLCLSSTAYAIEVLNLQLEQLRQGDMRLQNVSLKLELLDTQQLSLQARVERLSMPGLNNPLQHLSLSCAQVQDSPTHLRCADAHLHVKSLLDTQAQKIIFAYEKNSGHISLKIPRLQIAGSRLAVNFSNAANQWQAHVQTQQLSLDKLANHLSHWVTIPNSWVVSGVLKGDVSIQQNHSLDINAKLHSNNFSFSNAAGTQVGESLKLDLQVNAKQTSQQWEVDGDLKLHRGELYIEPVYVPVQKTAHLHTQLRWNTQQQQLDLHHIQYQHANILTLQGQLAMRFKDTLKLQTAQLSIPQFSLKAVQKAYLQTWLEDNSWNDLKTSGYSSVELDWQEEVGKLQIDTQKVNVLSKAGSITGLSGSLHWHSHHARPTNLRWDGIQLRNTFAFPAGQLNLRVQGDGAKLLTALHLPVLDGAVHLAELELGKLSSSQPQFNLSGRIDPISMELLTKTLSLPTLGGQLAAVIPNIAYKQQRLKMDGALLLQVFDGDIVIHHLSLQDPLGALPILNAAIDLKQLDLQTLTRFFEFGEISGRLSGYVKDLQLYKWQPIQFDAFVGTPEGAKGGKISQKAVSNLSNLGGGGVADTLSRGVLSFFESFSYARLGLGCRLRNNVCAMRGAGAAEGGYYLVKGGGLPRIDVKGFNQQVDWDVLLERLKNVTNLGAPVIQ